MKVEAQKKEIAKKLQAKINAIQGLGKVCGETKASIWPFAVAFPNQVFPTGSIHEFISYNPPGAASTSGFIMALAGKLMKDGGLCLWVGNERNVFPSGIKYFGLEPDRIVFIQASRQKDTLWIIEEALKCEAFTAVIGEIKELSFTGSRRLQLAVERSGVTGLIHRFVPRSENATACTARWEINPLPGLTDDGLPGVGHSCWNVQLLKVRNGIPASWQVSWSVGQFLPVSKKNLAMPSIHQRTAG